MTKQTTYRCNQCGKTDTIFPISDVNMRALHFLAQPLDFCCKACFLKYYDEHLQDFPDDNK